MRAVLLVLGLSVLGACSHMPTKPDLAMLYRGANIEREQPPVVLVPGITGSKLRDARSGKTVYPGSLWRILTSRYQKLRLDIDARQGVEIPTALEAYEVADTVAGQEFYVKIIRTLEQYGGFQRTVAGTAIGDAYRRRLYVMPYDWRQDNVVAARKLDALIEQIRKDYARPDLKVDIIAHSMGGLISRYFERYGTADVLDDPAPVATMAGGRKINRLILLGTPNLGSANAVHALVEGAKVFRTIPIEVVATMPGLYQLLPEMSRKPLIDIDGRPLRVSSISAGEDASIFDARTWEHLQWSVYDPGVAARLDPAYRARLQAFFARSLRRAGHMYALLQEKTPSPPVPTYLFGASCAMTSVRVLAEQTEAGFKPRFLPAEIASPRTGIDYERLMLEPGDGTVPKPSLLGRQSLDPRLATTAVGIQPAGSFFLCDKHSQLTGNIHFQNNLLDVLLSDGRSVSQQPAN